jgi:hypothetical protein
MKKYGLRPLLYFLKGKNFYKERNKWRDSHYIKADFIVDPECLKKVKVEDPVAVKIINISNITFLGDTGKKMAKAGFTFLITRKLAEKLVKDKDAIYV